MRKIRRKRQKILGLLLILVLFAAYKLWLAPYLALLNGQPVTEVLQAQEVPASGLTQQAQGTPEEAAEQADADKPETQDTPPQITITQRELGMGDNHITYYEADVWVSDASDLKTAFAHDTFGQGIQDTLTHVAEEHNASFAVNGDFYGYRSDGIVIRNGVLYRDVPSDRECLVLYQDGTAGIVKESDTSGQALLDAGAWNVFSFGPVLVENGQARTGLKEPYRVDEFSVSISGPEPRTAIGYIEPGHYLIVVADGRQTGYSRGMDFEELAKVFADYGCQLAYNLDGGGSVTLYSEGEVVNQPCPLIGKERSISDILYVEAVQ